MSNKLLLASLTALAASSALAAHAAPGTPVAPRPPAPLPTCTTGGDAVFVVDHKADHANLPQWKFTLLSKGMYELTRFDGGKTITVTGCAGTPNVSRILTAFAGAKWKVSSDGVPCAAYSAEYTEYSVGGRVVYVARMCNAARLDEASNKALDVALAIVKPFDVMPALAPSTPPSPPRAPAP
jgi:hypothetical protein